MLLCSLGSECWCVLCAFNLCFYKCLIALKFNLAGVGLCHGDYGGPVADMLCVADVFLRFKLKTIVHVPAVHAVRVHDFDLCFAQSLLIPGSQASWLNPCFAGRLCPVVVLFLQVHGGTGGVGLAALQLLKVLSAEPISTAGNPAKRALLRQLGAKVHLRFGVSGL